MAKPSIEWSPCGNYWFDSQAADAAASFFPRYLHFTEGEWAGHPFELESWQEHDIVRPLFGWKRNDGRGTVGSEEWRRTCTRRYRRCYVWVPRKNGKTELAAGVALLALLADGEMAGQVYSIAADKDQAKLVFQKAVSMVGWSDKLSEHLTCFKTSIWCPDLSAAFKPLSGTPEGKHGLNMSGLVGDEIHEWRDGRLYTFVHQSTASRRQPIEFLISTAGERSGYGWETWTYCQKVQTGEIKDEETLVVIYAADPEDDWTDPAVWAKANPNLGVSVKRSYLEAECRAGQELARRENDFKRYHLNIWTEQAIRWLPLHAWDACGWADPEKPEGDPARNDRWRDLPEQMTGRFATAGVDLSATADLTALVWTFPPTEEGGRWVMIPRFFVPEDRIAERVRRDRVPYDEWVKRGALTATPGNVVDYAFVKQQMFDDAERFKAGSIAFDRWNAIQMMVEVIAEGLEGVKFGQGYVSMSGPSKELERLVMSHRLDHGGHPVLRWCAGNVAVETDPAGNIKPAKDKSTERIDGIVAGIMGIGVAITQEADAPSVYEKRGALVF